MKRRNIEEVINKNMCCPVCKTEIEKVKQLIICKNKRCLKKYAIVNNVPILINEKNSIFSTEDYIKNRNTTFDLKKTL